MNNSYSSMTSSLSYCNNYLHYYSLICADDGDNRTLWFVSHLIFSSAGHSVAFTSHIESNTLFPNKELNCTTQ